MPRKQSGSKASAVASGLSHLSTQRLLDEIGNAVIDGRLTDWAKGFSRDVRTLAGSVMSQDEKAGK